MEPLASARLRQFAVLFFEDGEDSEDGEEIEIGWLSASLELFETLEDAEAWILDTGLLEISYIVAQVVAIREAKADSGQ